MPLRLTQPITDSAESRLSPLEQKLYEIAHPKLVDLRAAISAQLAGFTLHEKYPSQFRWFPSKLSGTLARQESEDLTEQQVLANLTSKLQTTDSDLEGIRNSLKHQYQHMFSLTCMHISDLLKACISLVEQFEKILSVPKEELDTQDESNIIDAKDKISGLRGKLAGDSAFILKWVELVKQYQAAMPAQQVINECKSSTARYLQIYQEHIQALFAILTDLANNQIFEQLNHQYINTHPFVLLPEECLFEIFDVTNDQGQPILGLADLAKVKRVNRKWHRVASDQNLIGNQTAPRICWLDPNMAKAKQNLTNLVPSTSTSAQSSSSNSRFRAGEQPKQLSTIGVHITVYSAGKPDQKNFFTNLTKTTGEAKDFGLVKAEINNQNIVSLFRFYDSHRMAYFADVGFYRNANLVAVIIDPTGKDLADTEKWLEILIPNFKREARDPNLLSVLIITKFDLAAQSAVTQEQLVSIAKAAGYCSVMQVRENTSQAELELIRTNLLELALVHKHGLHLAPAEEPQPSPKADAEQSSFITRMFQRMTM